MMLERISELEGASERLPASRESSLVKSKLQEARLAELERLRVHELPINDICRYGEMIKTMNAGLERGRRNGTSTRVEITGSPTEIERALTSL